MSSQAASIYARAAFEYASEQGEIASWVTWFDRAAQVFALDEIKDTIRLSQLGQRELVESLTEPLQSNQGQQHFLWLLADKKRLLAIPVIQKAFQVFCSEAKQEIAATVASVVPLRKTQLQSLADELTQREGQSVTLENVLDPTIYGGVVVRMGDKVIDRSIRGSFMKLQKHMLG